MQKLPNGIKLLTEDYGYRVEYQNKTIGKITHEASHLWKGVASSTLNPNVVHTYLRTTRHQVIDELKRLAEIKRVST